MLVAFTTTKMASTTIHPKPPQNKSIVVLLKPTFCALASRRRLCRPRMWLVRAVSELRGRRSSEESAGSREALGAGNCCSLERRPAKQLHVHSLYCLCTTLLVRAPTTLTHSLTHSLFTHCALSVHCHPTATLTHAVSVVLL